MRCCQSVPGLGGILILVFTVLSFGCRVQPEENSGPDGFRDRAAPIPLGEWLPDMVDKSGDKTDWRIFQTEFTDWVRVSVVVAESNAKISIGIYEVHGILVAETFKPKGVQPGFRIELKRRLGPGVYYARVRHLSGSGTAYSIRLDLGSEANSGSSVDSLAPPPE